jgi:hypothetical protein
MKRKIRITEGTIKKIVEEAINKILMTEDTWVDDTADIEEVFKKNGWKIEKLLEKNGASYYFMSRSEKHNGTTPKQIVSQLNMVLNYGKAEHLKHPMRKDLEIFRIA